MTEIKLSTVSSFKKKEKETYREAINRHLKNISPERGDSSPTVLFVLSVSDEDMSYQLLTENSTLEVVGALDVIKTFFMLDSSEGE